MKKIIICLLAIFMLTVCGCKKEYKKVKLDYEVMPTASDSSSYFYNRDQLLSYELDSTNEYDDKITNKDSFLLFIYSETCSGCKLLSPAIKPYIDENELVIYTLNYDKVSDKHDLYKAGVNTTPFLAVIEEGKIVYLELITLKMNDEESNVKTIEKWLNDRIEWRKS